jgi:hypothetical protein
MSVLCGDLYATFSTPLTVNRLRENRWKTFALYSMIGWGLPTLFTLLVILLDMKDTGGFFPRPMVMVVVL